MRKHKNREFTFATQQEETDQKLPSRSTNRYSRFIWQDHDQIEQHGGGQLLHTRTWERQTYRESASDLGLGGAVNQNRDKETHEEWIEPRWDMEPVFPIAENRKQKWIQLWHRKSKRRIELPYCRSKQRIRVQKMRTLRSGGLTACQCYSTKSTTNERRSGRHHKELPYPHTNSRTQATTAKTRAEKREGL
jgi:hypothetical protein